MKIFRPVAFSIILALAPAPAPAQSTSARVVGTATDSSDAALSGVTITVTNAATNAARSVTTDDSGEYVVPNLPIGTYQVIAERQGFKRYLLPSLKLDVDQAARVDVRMEVGDVTESVTVQGGAPLIESESSGIGQVVNNQTIVQLPLNGRNFIRLGSLVPGTTEGAPGSSVVRSRQGNVALTSNEQRAESNNYLLDGTDNNATLAGVAVVIPSVDAIQEFKVQTSNYSAEFGRGAGAIINLAVKSGTNDLHGTAYEFLRNDVFDARNTFAPAKDPLRRNQFGFSAGGPVVLPGFGEGGPVFAYNGRDRTFFFFNYEGLRERRGATGRFNVPTAAQRAGNFAGQPIVFDPLNVNAAGARVAFPGNQIPAGRLNPISQRVLNLIPLPNSSDPAANYIEQLSNPTDNNQVHVRVDHQITPDDQFFARYSWTNSDDVARSINFGDTATTIATRGLTLTHSHIFSPTVINEFRFGAQRYAFDQLPSGFGADNTSPLGLPLFSTGADFLRYPVIIIRNLTGLGGNPSLPVIRAENTFQWIDTLSVNVGKHTVRLGGDVRRYQLNNFQPQLSSGEYSFTGAFTGVRGSQYANGLADFLLGLPVQERVLNATGFDGNRIRNTRVNLFAQDDYQVSPRLTLNLGLRWERDGAWTEKDDRFAYFDFAAGQLVYPRGARTPFTGQGLVTVIVLIGLVATVYTTLGGIQGVIWTDVLQMTVLAGVVVAAIYVVLSRIDGGLASVVATATAEGKFNFINTSTNLADDFTVWNGILGGAFIMLALNGVDQSETQRFLTTPTLRESQVAISATMITSTIYGLSVYSLGILLYVFYLQHPEKGGFGINPDRVFPKFILEELPRGITGLVVAAVFSAAMSSMAAVLSSQSTVVLEDFYSRLTGRATSVVHARIGVIVFGVVGTIIACYVSALGTILVASNKLITFFGGTLVGTFLLGMLTRRANGWGAFLGALTGLAGVALLSSLTSVSFMWYGVFSATLAFASGYLYSLFFAAPSEEKARRLYGRSAEESGSRLVATEMN